MGPDTHERFRQMVELSPDAICIVRDSRITFLNAAAVQLIGATGPEEAIGLSIPNAIAGGTDPVRLEDQIVRLDGTVVDVEVTRAALGPSACPELVLVLRDITARKRTEAALRESEERLTLAFAGAQEGVWDWNLETGTVIYSPRWKQMLGYDAPHDDEIEPHVSAWERLLHPDDRARASEVNESVAARRRHLRGRVPPQAPGWTLHSCPFARLSRPPRARRRGRAHRRHPPRHFRAQADRNGAP